MRALLSVLLAAVACLAFAAPARAQESDAPDLRAEQLRKVRELPDDEKRRLKAALVRFRSMAPAAQEALRVKAAAVGDDRLGELAGRDFDALRRRRADMAAELREIEMLLGPERLAAMTPDERAYVRAEAMRGFQRRCRIWLLEAASLSDGFLQAPREERRRRLQVASQVVIGKMIEEKSAEERELLRTASPEERAEARAAMMHEWRLRQTTSYVKIFDGNRLVPMWRHSPEKRAEIIEAWKARPRWFELASALRDQGVSQQTVAMLRRLAPDELATVAVFVEETKNDPPDERRVRIETRVRELYGTGALDEARTTRRPPRYVDLLRERAQREKRVGQDVPAFPR